MHTVFSKFSRRWIVRRSWIHSGVLTHRAASLSLTNCILDVGESVVFRIISARPRHLSPFIRYRWGSVLLSKWLCWTTRLDETVIGIIVSWTRIPRTTQIIMFQSNGILDGVWTTKKVSCRVMTRSRWEKPIFSYDIQPLCWPTNIILWILHLYQLMLWRVVSRSWYHLPPWRSTVQWINVAQWWSYLY